jgi:hypothetical protein
MKFCSHGEMNREKKSTIYNNVHRRPDFPSGNIPGFWYTNLVLSVPKIVKRVWMPTTEEFGGKSFRIKNIKTYYSLNYYFRKSCRTFWCNDF